MSLLITINTNPTSTPKESLPDPDRLVEGDPKFKTWSQDASRDGEVNTGVWQATPGVTRSIKGKTFEFCHILEGEIELTPEDGEPVIYRAGDSFVMKPGYKGLWRTIKTVKKIFVTVS